MTRISLQIDNKNLTFDDTELRSKLIVLRNSQKNHCWIRSDLSVSKSTLIGRIMWMICKYFDCLRKFFYGVNLQKTQKTLEALYPILKHTPRHAELYKIYKNAVSVFEEIAPRHMLFSRETDKRHLDFSCYPFEFETCFEELEATSQGACLGSTKLALVEKVFMEINEKRVKGIFFNQKKVSRIISGGNCSALSLDFIKKYFTYPKYESDTLEKIKDIGPYYKRGGKDVGRLKEFRSIQAAFNCIEVIKQQEQIDFSKAKIQSIANYFNFKIGYNSSSFDIQNDSREKLHTMIKNLPEGAYLLRVLKPKQNEKLEKYGHSMVFIRSVRGDFFFDPNLGTEKITNQSESRLFWHLRNNWNKFKVSHARFYQMLPNPQPC